MEVAVAVAVESNPSTVRRPRRLEVRRDVRQLSQARTIRVHDVDLEIAIATAAEGDPSAIGREPRTEFIAGVVGQSRRASSIRVRDPNVPGARLDAVERNRAMQTVSLDIGVWPCNRELRCRPVVT